MCPRMFPRLRIRVACAALIFFISAPIDADETPPHRFLVIGASMSDNMAGTDFESFWISLALDVPILSDIGIGEFKLMKAFALPAVTIKTNESPGGANHRRVRRRPHPVRGKPSRSNSRKYQQSIPTLPNITIGSGRAFLFRAKFQKIRCSNSDTTSSSPLTSFIRISNSFATSMTLNQARVDNTNWIEPRIELQRS